MLLSFPPLSLPSMSKNGSYLEFRSKAHAKSGVRLHVADDLHQGALDIQVTLSLRPMLGRSGNSAQRLHCGIFCSFCLLPPIHTTCSMGPYLVDLVAAAECELGAHAQQMLLVLLNGCAIHFDLHLTALVLRINTTSSTFALPCPHHKTALGRQLGDWHLSRQCPP